MEKNKTISIFLASSEELQDDRVAFGDFIRRINDIYQKRSINIRLLKWEDFDSSVSTSMNSRDTHRKQDEYNQRIGQSDIFVALFHTRAGEFTVEEFNVALKLFQEKLTPKIFVFFKDVDNNTAEDESLIGFKQKTLHDKIGHYWGHYNSHDSLHFNFVMQLLLQIEDSSKTDDIKVEDGQVILYDITVANMQSLGFASGNETYQQMRQKISKYPKDIEKFRMMAEKASDDEMRQLMEEQLQEKLDDFNKLKEKCAAMERNLLDTALRITKMEQGNISDMVRRAIDAFEKVQVTLANELLDEVAHEAETHFMQLESQQELVHQDIDALLLQAKTVMADATIPIEERIARTTAIYEKADQWAEKSAYEKTKYDELLTDYYNFLNKYGDYKKALEIIKKETEVTISIYGKDSLQTAWSYDDLGFILYKNGEYESSMNYYNKSLEIQKDKEDNEKGLASLYNDLAILHEKLCHYEEALDLYKKSLVIDEKLYGKNHLNTAIMYSNIADLCNTLDQPEECEKYNDESIRIKKELLHEDDEQIASLYFDQADIFEKKGDFEIAMTYCQKALQVILRNLGKFHPRTASAYMNIGSLYALMSDYTACIEYQKKALEIYKKVYGEDSDMTASVYNSIGTSYSVSSHYKEAHDNYYKALELYQKLWGDEHMDLADIYESLLLCSLLDGNYEEALRYGLKAKKILKKLLGGQHRRKASLSNQISQVFSLMGRYDEALAYAHMASFHLLANNPDDKELIIDNGRTLAGVYYKLGNYSEAIEELQKALSLLFDTSGCYNLEALSIYILIGENYVRMKEYDKALDCYLKAQDIAKRLFDNSHFFFSSIYAGMARSYKGLGNKDLWARYLNAAVDQARDNLGEEHPFTKELSKELYLQNCPLIADARNLL